MKRIVAVFPSDAAAREAARAAVSAGADAATVGISQGQDERGMLMHEMQEEMDGATAGPLTAAIPGPARKAMYGTVVLAGAIGAVVGLLVALIPLGSWALSWRLLAYGLIGAAAGATIGFIIGAGLGAPGPAVPTTSEGGVTVGVNAPADRARSAAEAMADQGAIRVDLFPAEGAGHRLQPGPQASTTDGVRRVGNRLTQSGGDWPPDEPAH
ncbi:MAG: hypothetical protein ACRDZ8_15745 [Acidimicrobiales bacterium]